MRMDAAMASSMPKSKCGQCLRVCPCGVALGNRRATFAQRIHRRGVVDIRRLGKYDYTCGLSLDREIVRKQTVESHLSKHDREINGHKGEPSKRWGASFARSNAEPAMVAQRPDGQSDRTGLAVLRVSWLGAGLVP